MATAKRAAWTVQVALSLAVYGVIHDMVLLSAPAMGFKGDLEHLHDKLNGTAGRVLLASGDAGAAAFREAVQGLEEARAGRKSLALDYWRSSFDRLVQISGEDVPWPGDTEPPDR